MREVEDRLTPANPNGAANNTLSCRELARATNCRCRSDEGSSRRRCCRGRRSRGAVCRAAIVKNRVHHFASAPGSINQLDAAYQHRAVGLEGEGWEEGALKEEKAIVKQKNKTEQREEVGRRMVFTYRQWLDAQSLPALVRTQRTRRRRTRRTRWRDGPDGLDGGHLDSTTRVRIELVG